MISLSLVSPRVLLLVVEALFQELVLQPDVLVVLVGQLFLVQRLEVFHGLEVVFVVSLHDTQVL